MNSEPFHQSSARRVCVANVDPMTPLQIVRAHLKKATWNLTMRRTCQVIVANEKAKYTTRPLSDYHIPIGVGRMNRPSLSLILFVIFSTGLLWAVNGIAHEGGVADDSYVGDGRHHVVVPGSGGCLRTGSWT